MGRYTSSDSEDDRSRSKKKYKKKRSSSSSDDSYSSRRSSKKSKKSKKKSYRRSRSRSRSSEYRRRRSRSRSRGHRSRSRGRRSRSRGRRSRSRRRRSRSRGGRSRSRSVSRYKSRRSRSKSSSRSWRKKSRSPKKVSSRSDSMVKELKPEKEDPCAHIAGFADMSLTQQNEIRMKLALKAAAETDARLREQGVLLPSKKEGPDMAHDDDSKRLKAIQEIEGDSFSQQTFVSNRSQQKPKEETMDDVHEAAIFGDASSLPVSAPKGIVYTQMDSLLAPIFYEDSKVKWERWAKFVQDFRQKRLEGEELS